MSVVVYIPTGLSSPELEILLAKAQAAIDDGERTTVVTCSGGPGYACSLNIYGLRPVCGVCKSLTRKGLSKLRGSFEHEVTPPAVRLPSRDRQREAVLHSRQEIKQHVIEGVDVGQAAYSSYIGLSRDQDLEGRLASFSLNKLLASSEVLTIWFHALLQRVEATRVVLYNGRQNQYRPLLRVAQQMGVPVEVMEFSGQHSRCVYIFHDELPQDLNVLSRSLENAWHTTPDEDLRSKAGLSFYAHKRAGGVVNDSRSYVMGQEKGRLPSGWDAGKHNVAIFNSSEDEYAAVGGEYDKTLYRNQTEAITRICQSLCDDPGVMLWLRIHPNLSHVRWSFAKRLLDLGKYNNNIKVIPGDSTVSSYALLDACDTALSFGSTMGVEAAYWGKPSVLVGRCVYERLGSVYTPSSHDEVVALVRDRNLRPLPVEGALKVALFWSHAGQGISHFGGDRNAGFTFASETITKTRWERWVYSLAKFVEKGILGRAINYGLGSTRKRMREGRCGT